MNVELIPTLFKLCYPAGLMERVKVLILSYINKCALALDVVELFIRT